MRRMKGGGRRGGNVARNQHSTTAGVSNKSEQALRRSKVEIRRDGSIDDRRRKDAYDSDLLFAVMASRQEMMFEDRVFERLLSQAKAASMRPGGTPGSGCRGRRGEG